MNEQPSSRLCFLVHICSLSTLCPVPQLPARQTELLLILLLLCLLWRWLLLLILSCPDFLISALPWLSAVCCLGCLSRPVSGPYDLSVFPSNGCDVNIGLLLPWPTMHLQTHPLAPTPQNHDWLLRWRLPAVLRFHFLLAPLVAPYPAHVLYQLVTALPCAVYDWLCFGERCSSPKFGLLADRYHFCEKCFNEIQGETVSLGDDPTQPQTWVSVHFMYCMCFKWDLLGFRFLEGTFPPASHSIIGTSMCVSVVELLHVLNFDV